MKTSNLHSCTWAHRLVLLLLKGHIIQAEGTSEKKRKTKQTWFWHSCPAFNTQAWTLVSEAPQRPRGWTATQGGVKGHELRTLGRLQACFVVSKHPLNDYFLAIWWIGIESDTDISCPPRDGIKFSDSLVFFRPAQSLIQHFNPSNTLINDQITDCSASAVLCVW